MRGVTLLAVATLLDRCDAVVLLRGGPSLRVLARCGTFCNMQIQGDEPVAATDPVEAAVAQAATGPVDLSTLDFDERLAVLASQIPETAAAQEEDDGVFPEGSPETRFWNPAFWALCAQDLQELEWPSRKSVFQTLFISQIAFVIIIMLTLVFDAIVESGVKALLLDEPFTLTMDKIMKVQGQ